jgi:hypothetical protein
VLAVSVGGVRQVPTGLRVLETGIWKAPVAVRGVNLDGDDQADRTVHGGPDKAVYAYALEDTRWWEAQLGREPGPGAFGVCSRHPPCRWCSASGSSGATADRTDWPRRTGADRRRPDSASSTFGPWT